MRTSGLGYTTLDLVVVKHVRSLFIRNDMEGIIATCVDLQYEHTLLNNYHRRNLCGY
jgi:hypothetical protein